jgi:hypothetical protein
VGKTGLIFTRIEPIKEAGSIPVKLCGSMANRLFFKGLSKSGCFPKKILTWSLIDYSLEHLLENDLNFKEQLKYKT